MLCVYGSVIPYNMVTVIIHLSKPLECTTAKANLNVNFEISSTKMCQCRIIDCAKYIILLQDVDNQWGKLCRDYGVFSTALKMKSMF